MLAGRDGEENARRCAAVHQGVNAAAVTRGAHHEKLRGVLETATLAFEQLRSDLGRRRCAEELRRMNDEDPMDPCRKRGNGGGDGGAIISGHLELRSAGARSAHPMLVSEESGKLRAEAGPLA